MDLLSAKREAIDRSRKEKRSIYIIVDGDGECTINAAPLKGSIACYKNGSEIGLPPNVAADLENSEAQLKANKALKSKNKALRAINKATENDTQEENSEAQLKNKNRKGKVSQPVSVEEKSNTKEMATKTKKPAKKVKKESKSTGFNKEDKKTWGKKVNVSIKAMRDGLKKGFIYRDPQGVKQTEAYLSTRSNQEYVREGMYLSGPF